MNALIIEDERLTAERLKSLVLECQPNLEILSWLPSVQKSIDWLRRNEHPDLIFLDIQLSDGTAFDILKAIPDHPPVIFTTAYDHYAVKAFKYNSIDYLLKPIEISELYKALTKFFSNHKQAPDFGSYHQLNRIISRDFKKRFLVKVGDQFQTVKVRDIAYFVYHDGMTYLQCTDQNRLPIDYSLDQLEKILNPLDYFRVNRKHLVSVGSIDQIHSYFNSRLLLRIIPAATEEVIVSRDRVGEFKKWMDL